LRSFFRRALKDFLAPETLAKSKHGFGLPFGLWLNEDPSLKEFADDNLHKIRHRGILNENYIGKIIQAHESGHASYYGVMIWVLIMLEQWMQTHNIG
jgi:asparagine synthase (glutamine-hydrolysing)